MIEASHRRTPRHTLDWLFPTMCAGASFCLFLPFVLMLIEIVARGAGDFNWQYITSRPTAAGRSGGVWPIIVSTSAVLGITLFVSLPLSLFTAIALTHSKAQHHWLCRLTRQSLDLLAAVPSIVFGLFGNAFFCVLLGMGYSLLAGGLTMACMILPMLTRLLEMTLRSVPDSYRQAATALGLSDTATVFRVIIPNAVPGIATAIVLSLGRSLAETAALLYTSGYATRMPTGLWDSGRTLSVHVYDLSMNVAGGNSRAFTASLTLIAVFFLLNLIAVLIQHRMKRSRLGCGK